MKDNHEKKLNLRFDGFLPIIVDVETTGVDLTKHGLLELAVVLVDYNEAGLLVPIEKDFWHIEPFENAAIDPKAMAVNQIDHTHPFRFAKSESEVLKEFFGLVEKALKRTQCRRALLVGHNAHFDLNFILTAAKRCHLTELPLHSFSCIDTATLGGFIYGKTVLAKILKKANIAFNKEEAHSAIYDAEKTAELFCKVINEHPFNA